MTENDLFDAIAKGDMGRLTRVLGETPALAGARAPDGVSALLYARYRDNLPAVEALLGANPPIDAFDAAALGRTGRLRELLAAQPELATAYSADGFTPLHLAAFFGQAETARVLIHAGAPLGAVSRNDLQVQPLNSAAAGRRDEVARLLIEAGADVNGAQRHGYTPLHAAAQNGDVELVDLLLDRGARVDARTNDGRTPADLADEANHAMLAKRLRTGVAPGQDRSR
jgi:ankyrin repeat protein